MNRRLHSTALKLVPVVVAAGLALAGCGSEPTNTADQNPTPVAGTATPPPISGTPGNAAPGGTASSGTGTGTGDNTGTHAGGGAVPGGDSTTTAFAKHKKDDKKGSAPGTPEAGAPTGGVVGSPAGGPTAN